ncbi:MAG: hypothetical protein ACI38A_09640 [Candidatus Ornithomonoglobus sp.]
MRKVFRNPEIKISIFDGVVGTTDDPLSVSGTNTGDARLSLNDVENVMVKSFQELQFKE